MNGAYGTVNYLHDQTSVVTTSGSVDPLNYPDTIMYDGAVALQWKAASKTGVWLKVDLGPVPPYRIVRVVALLNHNLMSGATVTLEGNDTDTWGSPAYSQVLTWGAPHIVGTPNMVVRWWRVTIEDAGNPHYLRVGEFYVGSLMVFPRNFDFPKRARQKYNATLTGFAGGISAVNYSTLEHYQLHWSSLTASEFGVVESLMDDTQGSVFPSLFLPDAGSTEAFYMRIVSDRLGYEEITNDLYGNVTLDLVELPLSVNG